MKRLLYPRKLWKITGILLVNLKLMLQSWWAEPLYLPVIWQWSLTWISFSEYYFITNLIWHSSAVLKSCWSSFVNIISLLNIFYSFFGSIFLLLIYFLNVCEQHFLLCISELVAIFIIITIDDLIATWTCWVCVFFICFCNGFILFCWHPCIFSVIASKSA